MNNAGGKYALPETDGEGHTDEALIKGYTFAYGSGRIQRLTSPELSPKDIPLPMEAAESNSHTAEAFIKGARPS